MSPSSRSVTRKYTICRQSKKDCRGWKSRESEAFMVRDTAAFWPDISSWSECECKATIVSVGISRNVEEKNGREWSDTGRNGEGGGRRASSVSRKNRQTWCLPVTRVTLPFDNVKFRLPDRARDHTPLTLSFQTDGK